MVYDEPPPHFPHVSKRSAASAFGTFHLSVYERTFIVAFVFSKLFYWLKLAHLPSNIKKVK